MDRHFHVIYEWGFWVYVVSLVTIVVLRQLFLTWRERRRSPTPLFSVGDVLYTKDRLGSVGQVTQVIEHQRFAEVPLQPGVEITFRNGDTVWLPQEIVATVYFKK